MGALIFYTFVYSIGHYAAIVFNTLAKKELFNRYWAGFSGVIVVAVMHAYKIINSIGHEEDVTYAVSYFVIFPVVVIAVVLIYLNGKDKKDEKNKNNDSE
ncbi:hypothetical protein Nstercoris_01567 [Nitrosomonas stercoris]|uniref:Uncharacterized protein n=1 Tax=Nitrosomonas stercoris TaxID=1444684 RepID=A0A4Y1YMQ8_9PROT|nr:hypothetical protein Nstercoris_01567 [Nitrosomonas stercoris]